jgi:hypothetical protein
VYYLHINMGNYISLHKQPIYELKHVRLLDTEHQIYIGLDDKNIKYIRIGDYTHKYYPVTMYSWTKNRLKYEFENDIFLIITKNNNVVTIKFADMTKNVIFTKDMESKIIKEFTRIDSGNVSRYINDIYDLIKFTI